MNFSDECVKGLGVTRSNLEWKDCFWKYNTATMWTVGKATVM